MTGIFLLTFIPKLILILFSLIYYIIGFLLWLLKKITYIKSNLFNRFRKIWMYTGLIISAFMFLQVVYGMVWGKSNFEVEEINISSDRIPSSFDGFRIAQISDIHLGSFKNDKILRKGMGMLMAQKPDLIVLTGDIVNNEAIEIEEYKEVLSLLEAPYGIYSILGNHDMGDYRRWYNEREKNCNLNQLVAYQESFGWKVLLNNHDYISINNDSIVIIGVKNWGKPPFKTYGNLTEARENVSSNIFSILLSHDPSHWTYEVLFKTPVDLTLSGHTHGFQFGFSKGNFRISPVQLKYKHWSGLYEQNEQYLYVNRGFGYIGFAGRVGMNPEITLITLNHLDSVP
ncbi:MAG: metallophosphoesterase [Bacteroidales bacterium]|nr:metallophosphoesterase [Bacteroidales bacterium]